MGNGTIFNQAAQLWNHNFFWKSLSPEGGGEPTGQIATLVGKYFNSFDTFKARWASVASAHFGSGWVWLVQDEDGLVSIVATSDAGNPLRDGLRPLLVMDVWEHAYYIDHRNARAPYIDAWFKLVNWEFANANLR